MKRGDEGAFPPADTTNDTARGRDGRYRAVEAMGRAEPYRNRRSLWSMIRHGMFLCGSPGFRLAQPVSALTVSMIEPAFKAALMPAAGLASLRKTSPETT